MFRILGAALVLWLSFHGAVLAGPLYTVEELLPLPGYTIAHANAINESGQVVGYSYAPGPDPEAEAFGALVSATFWDQQGAWNIGAGGGTVAFNAIDINDVGQIVGIVRVNDNFPQPDDSGAIGGQDLGSGGSGNWATLAPGSFAPMPITSQGCFVDNMLYAISSTGYMLGGFGSGSGPTSIHSPNLDTFLCGLDVLQLYESGLALTGYGYVFDPLVDGSRQWVVVPTCAGEITGHMISPGSFGVPSVISPLEVSSQIAAGICDLAADAFTRDRHRNTSGQFIVNVGDRAFLFTAIPEPSTLALLGIGLAGLALGRRKRAA